MKINTQTQINEEYKVSEVISVFNELYVNDKGNGATVTLSSELIEAVVRILDEIKNQ